MAATSGVGDEARLQPQPPQRLGDGARGGGVVVQHVHALAGDGPGLGRWRRERGADEGAHLADVVEGLEQVVHHPQLQRLLRGARARGSPSSAGCGPAGSAPAPAAPAPGRQSPGRFLSVTMRSTGSLRSSSRASSAVPRFEHLALLAHQVPEDHADDALVVDDQHSLALGGRLLGGGGEASRGRRWRAAAGPAASPWAARLSCARCSWAMRRHTASPRPVPRLLLET